GKQPRLHQGSIGKKHSEFGPRKVNNTGCSFAALYAISPLDPSTKAPAAFDASAERWQSGRMHRTRNAACSQGHRGFESLPLRHPPTACSHTDISLAETAGVRRVCRCRPPPPVMRVRLWLRPSAPRPSEIADLEPLQPRL